MAANITNPFTELNRRLRRLSGDAPNEVKGILEFWAGKIVLDAKRLAPSSSDNIATQSGTEKLSDIIGDKGWTSIDQAISYKRSNNGYTYEIVVDKSAGDVAAWVEFGTGQSARSYLATVPAEWKAVAQKYYVNGKGTIIDKPYLYPSFIKGKKKATDEIKAYIASLSL